MELFEILFIALFVLIPIFEGVLRKKSPKEPPGAERRPRGAGGSPEARPEGRPEGRPEPASAAEMVPEDLWEMLTGERRGSRPATVETPPDTSLERDEPQPWSAEPAWSPASREPELEERSEWEARPMSEEWSSLEQPSPLEERLPPSEPVSLEYLGPEAYSLEQPLPSPEVRHARFHDKIDRPPRTRRTPVPSVIRTLGRSSGLRDAVVLSEVLGPPKGLE